MGSIILAVDHDRGMGRREDDRGGREEDGGVLGGEPGVGACGSADEWGGVWGGWWVGCKEEAT